MDIIKAIENKNISFYGLTPTAEQLQYIDSIFTKDVIFVNAPSGTGKTTVATACAHYISHNKGIIKNKKGIDGLLYTFHPTEEDQMGHRPGNQDEKEDAYLGPLYDALTKINEFPLKVNSSGYWVEARSHTFYRGRTIENKVVIIDEAQNWPWKKLKKMLTRIVDNNCIAIVIGHVGQIDLANPRESGLLPYIKHFDGMPKAAIINLTYDFRGWLSKHADSLILE